MISLGNISHHYFLFISCHCKTLPRLDFTLSSISMYFSSIAWEPLFPLPFLYFTSFSWIRKYLIKLFLNHLLKEYSKTQLFLKPKICVLRIFLPSLDLHSRLSGELELDCLARKHRGIARVLQNWNTKSKLVTISAGEDNIEHCREWWKEKVGIVWRRLSDVWWQYLVYQGIMNRWDYCQKIFIILSSPGYCQWRRALTRPEILFVKTLPAFHQLKWWK